MKRKYKFYDKEATSPTEITFDFPQPFYENVDAHLKNVHNILFIKEINHNSRIIRLHTAYDSGKGMRYVPYEKKKKIDFFDDNYTPVITDISNYTIGDLEEICIKGEKNKAVKLYGTFLREMGVCPDMPCWIPEVSQFIENPIVNHSANATLIKPRIDFIKEQRRFK